MHKMIEYVCNELEELERKADKEGKLSMAELQYADTLTRIKKNILKADELWEESEYSNEGSYAYARGRGTNARRDSMGRYTSRGSYDDGSMNNRSYEGNRGGNRGYSRAEDDFRMDLQELMRSAPNDHVRKKLQSLADEM